MSEIRSFSVGNGDMFSIRHGNGTLTIIDCCLRDRGGSILSELRAAARHAGVVRFISTHPDQDHISGLVDLDDSFAFQNFYVVKNVSIKTTKTADFERYCHLRDDPKKAFYVYRGCSRRWLTDGDEGRGSSGLQILWPIVDDPDHQSALVDAARGLPPNNTSCIIKYSLQNGVTAVWMGDLETDFMEKLEKKIDMPAINILFAPHHGRDSGKVPKGWLDQMSPGLVIIGEAPSEYLNYYAGHETVTQNSTGDILFECVKQETHVFVADHTYRADCLEDRGLDHRHGLYYVGTLPC